MNEETKSRGVAGPASGGPPGRPRQSRGLAIEQSARPEDASVSGPKSRDARGPEAGRDGAHDRSDSRPFVIGIGGGSASGKSTLAAELQDRLAPRRVAIVNQDKSFWPTDQLPKHRNPDGSKEWPDFNQPGSVNWPDLRARVRAAIADHADVVIVEGTLVLYDAELRELLDLKLFVAAAADERIVRRIRRNVSRGYDLGGICDFYIDSVRYRHGEFCEPTRAHADLVLPGGRYDRAEAEAILDAVVRRVLAAGE